jgi:hypothetical protein
VGGRGGDLWVGRGRQRPLRGRRRADQLARGDDRPSARVSRRWRRSTGSSGACRPTPPRST